MKSKLVLFVAILLVSSFSFAQTQKGNWIISGNSSLQVMNAKPEQASSGVTTVTLNPSVGYFVIDGLAVGAGVTLVSAEGSTVFAVLPTASYYFQTASSVKPYLQLGVGYGSLKSGGNSLGGLALGAGGGIVYLINKNVGLNAGLQYVRGDYDGNVTNTFGGVLGFSLFF